MAAVSACGLPDSSASSAVYRRSVNCATVSYEEGIKTGMHNTCTRCSAINHIPLAIFIILESAVFRQHRLSSTLVLEYTVLLKYLYAKVISFCMQEHEHIYSCPFKFCMRMCMWRAYGTIHLHTYVFIFVRICSCLYVNV